MNTDANDRVLVRYVWMQIAVFVIVAAIATYFSSVQLEVVVVGWIVLIVLFLLCLCAAYGVSKKILAGATFAVAALFVGASLLWRDSWVVGQTDLVDFAVGAAACAASLLAIDARTGEPVHLVGHIAGALTAGAMLLLGTMLVSGASSQPLRIIFAIALLAAFYDLSGPKWKIPLSIVAVIVIVIVIVAIATHTA